MRTLAASAPVAAATLSLGSCTRCSDALSLCDWALCYTGASRFALGSAEATAVSVPL